MTSAHEVGTTCDFCAQPRPLLIEQEDGSWLCEVCTGNFSVDDLWRLAVLDAIYPSLGE